MKRRRKRLPKPHPCLFPGCTGEATRWSRRGYCELHVSEPHRKAVTVLVRPHEFYPKPPPLVFNQYGYAVVKQTPGGLRV